MKCDDPSMSSPGGPRTPPDVIRVLPPPATLVPFIIWLAMGALAIMLGILILMGEGAWTRLSAILIVVGVVGPFALALQNRRRTVHDNAVRTQLLKDLGHSADDRSVVAIRRVWSGGRPVFTDLEAAIAKLPAPDPPAARVVCLGLVDVPKVNDYRCEPEVISPLGVVSRGLVPFLLFFGAVFCIGELGRMGLIPIAWTLRRSTPFVVLALTWGAWALKVFLQPTYVRVAPGVVEFLKFRLRGGRPTIRRYPMEAGTSVIITDKRSGHVLDLRRGRQHDRISLRDMRHAEVVLDRLLRAILSTAPIPTMSEEELIG